MRNLFSVNILACGLFSLLLVAPVRGEEDYLNIQNLNHEEALFVRRIAEFWKDGDFVLVKRQIQDFFSKYPNSEYKDYFSGILGDLCLQDHLHEEALSHYHSIKDKNIHEKILLNQLHCYYSLSQYEQLQAEGEPYLKTQVFKNRENEYLFLMAEAYFRQALATKSNLDKGTFAEKAKPLYEQLLTTSYDHFAQFALSEVLLMMGETTEASDLYLKLAAQHVDQKEDLLFQAATVQADINTQKAINIFSQIVELDGPKKTDALYNRLVLHFQNEDYDAVIQEAPSLKTTLAAAYLPHYNYMLGKSYFSKEEYEQALPLLQEYIQSQEAPSNQLRSAYLIQISIANERKDASLLNSSLEAFQKLYPQDNELPKALFMHALLCQETGEISQAQRMLSDLLAKYPDFEQQELLHFQHALSMYQSKNWEPARTNLAKFLQQFPSSDQAADAWKFYLSSCSALFQQTHQIDPHMYPKAAFLDDIHTSLDKSGVSEEEKAQYMLLAAKLSYEIDKYTLALETLSAIAQNRLSTEEQSEIHYLTALCHFANSGDPLEGCAHLEQALALNPETFDNPALHLQLFNAYLSSADTAEDQHMLDKAADHLYRALEKQHPIKLENRLWLADYYHKKADFEDELAYQLNLEKAQRVYEETLLDPSNKQLLQLSKETIAAESAIFQYLQVLDIVGKSKEKIFILQNLIEQQNRNNQWDWSHENMALFELSMAYLHQGDKTRAFETLVFIRPRLDTLPTAAAGMAKLQLAKLQLEKIHKSKFSNDNPEVVEMLCDLKDLQIQKNPQTEPLHLEAALQYAKVRSLLSENKNSSLLAALCRIQEDFTNGEDAMTEQYHQALKTLPKKQKTFHHYMQFIDAEKMRLQASLAEEKQQQKTYESKAKSLLGQLSHDALITKELDLHIQESLRAL